uniref:Uncharacterized protein n=1 Tax=Oryza rufipogon TaxID=4529 RepID=A0A0E0PQI7_ORYRU
MQQLSGRVRSSQTNSRELDSPAARGIEISSSWSGSRLIISSPSAPRSQGIFRWPA